jgi:tRNA 2-thiouridine synthesizing protein E
MATVATLGTRQVHVDEEGFLTEYGEWDDELAKVLAANIGVELTDDAWKVIRFARADYQATSESPTLRRITNVGGIPTKELFQLFPKKPAKKIAYIAGLPKPVGCV